MKYPAPPIYSGFARAAPRRASEYSGAARAALTNVMTSIAGPAWIAMNASNLEADADVHHLDDDPGSLFRIVINHIFYEG